MNVSRWTPLGDRDVVNPLGEYVEWVDYYTLYQTAQLLADALDKMPCISDGHLQIKDQALFTFRENTLIP